MKRQQFVNGHLDILIENDKDIKKYFANAQSEEEKMKLKHGLERSLNDAYEKYASDYFGSKGVGSYVSKFLRWTGAAADVVGTYLFWSFGGSGMGFKALGLAEKTIADIVDNYHYEKHKVDDGTITKDGLSLLGETLLERIAAYWPLGIGEIADLHRGTKKYDMKILGQALAHAKMGFIKSHGNYEMKDDLKIASLDNFRNRTYLDDTIRQAA
ncbi:hypothetical protein HOC35_01645 [Candidatus Woesearchaeota archaeon]|jgi:hypothetical protein|nr:hypothetical protein [Candidatus Woesearchaeota archaeon]